MSKGYADLPPWMQHELTKSIRPQLERLAQIRGASDEVVDDATMELVDRLLNRRWTGEIEQALAGNDSESARRALRSLAMLICKRRIADELRREWRRELVLRTSPEEAVTSTMGSYRSPLVPESTMLFRAVLEAMERLSIADREHIVAAVERDRQFLQDVEGEEYRRAAVRLLKSKPAAKPDNLSPTGRSRLHRARRRLAAEVQRILADRKDV